MILVLIFLGIIIIFILITFLLVISKLRFEIKDFEVSNTNVIIAKNSEIKISFNLFGKIKLVSFKANNKLNKKIYSKFKLEKINVSQIKQKFSLKDIEMLKNLKPELMYLNLKLNLGVEDVILTSTIIFIISTAISIILPYIVKRYDENNYEYSVTPLFINKNAYYIKLNCIIQLKMVHIIKIIYIYLKKGKSDKNERTSNRKSYDYSYE